MNCAGDTCAAHDDYVLYVPLSFGIKACDLKFISQIQLRVIMFGWTDMAQ
jgi:hypothetical protein